MLKGVSWWPSRLRTWYCHCYGLGLYPVPGTSACLRVWPKNKTKQKKNENKNHIESVYVYIHTSIGHIHGIYGSSQARDQT